MNRNVHIRAMNWVLMWTFFLSFNPTINLSPPHKLSYWNGLPFLFFFLPPPAQAPKPDKKIDQRIEELTEWSVDLLEIKGANRRGFSKLY